MNRIIKQALQAGALAFVLAMIISFGSDTLIERLPVMAALVVLLAIILFGVISDTVGISVAAADASPFHAMAARKVFGARQGTRMIKNADRVAIFCNDVIGDICGTVSGAVGAAIVFRIMTDHSGTGWPHLLMIGLVSLLTVGGKALGKGMAIRYSTYIVLQASRCLAFIEMVTGHEFLDGGKGRKKGKR